MKKWFGRLTAFVLVILVLFLFGGVALAGDCPGGVCQAQQSQYAQPVVVAQAYAAPLYVVPGAPQVLIQPYTVVQQQVVQQKVVKQQVVQKQVIQQQKFQRPQVQRQRSLLIQRSVTR